MNTNNHIAVLAALTCLCAFPCRTAYGKNHSFEATQAQRQQLLALRESAWRSWFQNDQSRLKTLLPVELIAINAGDAVWQSQAEVMAGAQEFATHHGRLISLQFPKTEIQMLGKVAVLFSLYEVRFEYDGQEQRESGRATEIFLLEHGQWLLTGWHVDLGK